MATLTNQPQSAKLDFEFIAGTFGTYREKTEKDLTAFMDKLNPDNPADLVRLQRHFHLWTAATELHSKTISNMKDSMRNVISKI